MKALFFGALLIAGLFTLVPGRLLGNLLWHREWPYGRLGTDANPVQRAAAVR